MSEEYLDEPIPKDVTAGDQYELVITTTVTIEHTVPLTSQYYPEEATIRDALNFERNRELSDKLETFADDLIAAPEDKVDFGERLVVQRVQRKSD